MLKDITYPLKHKIASFIFGVIGGMWFVSCVLSFTALPTDVILFCFGASLVSICIAIEPAFLFRNSSLTSKAAQKSSKLGKFVIMLNTSSLTLFFLSGLLWLFDNY